MAGLKAYADPEAQKEIERLRVRLEQEKIITESFKAAAATMASAFQGEIDMLRNALNAAFPGEY